METKEHSGALESFIPRNENESTEEYLARCEREIDKIDKAIKKLEESIKEREESENNIKQQ